MCAASATPAPELGKEYPPVGEQEAINRLRDITERTMVAKSHDPTLRDVHPKSHGYVSASFTVHDDLPVALRAGVFATPATYNAWIRFSNGSSDRTEDGNFLPDTIGDVRGMAIKLTGIKGKFASPGFDHAGEQDFILMNSPRFFIKDVADYIVFFEFMRKLKEKVIKLGPDGKPTVLPDEFKPAYEQIKYALAIIGAIKQQATPSPLQIPYWSATPYRLGPHAMKFSVVPQFAGPLFDSTPVPDQGNYLREAIASQLREREAIFDFLIELQSDPVKMKIEDATAIWDSPTTKVATITIPIQDINTPERLALDERQSFSPWHSLAAHQPLGGVNRARKMYADMARARNAIN